jgi:cyclic pyranopterin phosphate synthase
MRIAVTDRCNFKCLYCSPLGTAVVDREDLLSFEEIHILAGVAVREGIDRIRLTGGEPTTRRNLQRLVEMLSSVEGLNDLSMTTNGLLLSSMAGELKSAGLSRVNISLDTLDREKFQRMTGVDGLERVLKGVDAARSHGLDPVKINVVAIRGFNDEEVHDFAMLAATEALTVRFIEMMPFHCNRGLQKDHFLSTTTILELLQEKLPLEEYEGGRPDAGGPGPARYYRVPGEAGLIGLISPFSRPFCASCNRLRLTSKGGLRNCLFSDSEVDLKSLLRGGASTEALAGAIRAAILSKKNGHRLVHGQPGCRTISLSQIGG